MGPRVGAEELVGAFVGFAEVGLAFVGAFAARGHTQQTSAARRQRVGMRAGVTFARLGDDALGVTALYVFHCAFVLPLPLSLLDAQQRVYQADQ